MSDETTTSRTCAVCGLAPGDVCDSTLGPTSYAFCQTCLGKRAEAIGVVCLWIHLQGGPTNVEKNDAGGGFREIKSYDDGRYIDWPEILAIYPRFETQFSGS